MSLNAQIQDLVGKAREHAPPEVFQKLGAMFGRLQADGVGASAPKAGDRAPDVTLEPPDGPPVPLRKLLGDKPMVLMFYRGRWCPFCDLTLRAFEAALPQFEAAGATLAAVSPQTLAETKLTGSERNLSYPLYSDPRNAAARSFGLDWQVQEGAERGLYKGFNSHVDQANGDDEWRLPSPAVFVIDRDGVVRWSWTDSNWTRRAEPDDVLAAVKAIGRQ